MPKLIIPTRNRPVSASRVLHYLAEFYPGAEVIVADGSAAQYGPAYDEAIAACSAKLRIDYRRYDPTVTLANRLTDVLQSIDDELVIVGADDDYPVLDVLAAAAPHLIGNPDLRCRNWCGRIIGVRGEREHSCAFDARAYNRATDRGNAHC